MRLDFMVYADGEAYRALGQSLKDDQHEETSAGGDMPVVAHFTFEGDGNDGEAMILDGLSLINQDSPNTLERLVTAAFKAGREYEKSQQ